jgi:hypothetical protein
MGKFFLTIKVGFGDKIINKTSSNYTSHGYFFYLNGGTLYSKSGDSSKSYVSNSSNNGDIYGAVFDKKKGEIKFYKGGKSLGVAYQNLKKLDLYPVLDFYNTGSSVQVVTGKYKK